MLLAAAVAAGQNVQYEMLESHIRAPVVAVATADHEIVEHNMGHIPTVDLLPALADLDVAVVAADVDRAVADTD